MMQFYVMYGPQQTIQLRLIVFSDSFSMSPIVEKCPIIAHLFNTRWHHQERLKNKVMTLKFTVIWYLELYFFQSDFDEAFDSVKTVVEDYNAAIQ